VSLATGSDDARALGRSLEQPAAFAELFDRHFDAVHRYLHRRAGVDLADELAAETFVVAFAQRARFVDRDDLGALPWLYGIATNLLRGSRRRERRRLRAYARTGVDASSMLDTDASISRLDAARDGARVAGALARLRAVDRDVFLLVTLAGLTYTEAAAALELAPGTVATRMRRARTQLARDLAPTPLTTETLADA
jgi:RNA polymerase sigma-70 factor (ECF subfamily)